jgi:hypothetical protein
MNLAYSHRLVNVLCPLVQAQRKRKGNEEVFMSGVDGRCSTRTAEKLPDGVSFLSQKLTDEMITRKDPFQVVKIATALICLRENAKLMVVMEFDN